MLNRTAERLARAAHDRTIGVLVSRSDQCGLLWWVGVLRHRGRVGPAIGSDAVVCEGERLRRRPLARPEVT